VGRETEESTRKERGPPPPVFSQVLILKVDKVVCFDALLQVLILKGVSGACRPAKARKGLTQRALRLEERGRGDVEKRTGPARRSLPKLQLGPQKRVGKLLIPRGRVVRGYPTPGVLEKEAGFA
jgi:hypothetical protein